MIDYLIMVEGIANFQSTLAFNSVVVSVIEL